MFPLSVLTYVKMGVCVALLAGTWYLSYSFEHKRFVDFQHVVREEAAKQEAKVINHKTTNISYKRNSR